jgi:hypothetical protein
LFCIAPHFFVVFSQIVDAVYHNKVKVSIINLFLEGFDQAGSVTVF